MVKLFEFLTKIEQVSVLLSILCVKTLVEENNMICDKSIRALRMGTPENWYFDNHLMIHILVCSHLVIKANLQYFAK